MFPNNHLQGGTTQREHPIYNFQKPIHNIKYPQFHFQFMFSISDRRHRLIRPNKKLLRKNYLQTDDCINAINIFKPLPEVPTLSIQLGLLVNNVFNLMYCKNEYISFLCLFRAFKNIRSEKRFLIPLQCTVYSKTLKEIISLPFPLFPYFWIHEISIDLRKCEFSSIIHFCGHHFIHFLVKSYILPEILP